MHHSPALKNVDWTFYYCNGTGISNRAIQRFSGQILGFLVLSVTGKIEPDNANEICSTHLDLDDDLIHDQAGVGVADLGYPPADGLEVLLGQAPDGGGRGDDAKCFMTDRYGVCVCARARVCVFVFVFACVRATSNQAGVGVADLGYPPADGLEDLLGQALDGDGMGATRRAYGSRSRAGSQSKKRRQQQ